MKWNLKAHLNSDPGAARRVWRPRFSVSSAPDSLTLRQETGLSTRALRRLVLPTCLVGLAGLALLSAGLLRAQVPWGYPPPPGPTPTTPMAQQNAQRTVQTQVNWFQNSTQTASNYGGGGYGMVWQQFQMLQGAFNAFKATLSQQQLSAGANELAELDAGLGILEEAFSNYTQDVQAGQSSASAFSEMCQVLNQASGVWLQEFNSVCRRLQVGWR